MPVPIYPMIRDGLQVLTKKLATEVLVSSLATLLVMALFSNVMKATPPAANPAAYAAARLAAANSAKTADFMEKVALSHVVGLKPATTAPVSDAPESAPVLAANAPALAIAPSPLPGLHGRDHPHGSSVHVAANIPAVLPPPRPSLAAFEPAIVAAPRKIRSHSVVDYGLRPLRFGMHLVTNVADLVPASGTRVVEGVASVGDAITTFAKKL